jgi:polysaccharide export outer membrane protein
LLERAWLVYLDGDMSLMVRYFGGPLLVFAALAHGAAEVAGQSKAPPAEATVKRLRPGDVITLWVWREEDMAGDFTVSETGVVVLPRIGPRHVLDSEPAALRDSLLTEFRKTLNNPSIEIRFGRRVTILGAVREPGLYTVDETMTIAEALAKAGGTLPTGKPDEVRLFRGEEVVRSKITQRTSIKNLPLQSGDQLYVPERGWLIRNSGIASVLLSGLVSVTIALIVQNK